MGFTFNGQTISKDQRDSLMQIGMLGKSGLIKDSAAAPMIAQTLMQKPSQFQQNLSSYLSGKYNQPQQQAQPRSQYTYTNERPPMSLPLSQTQPTTSPAPTPVDNTPGSFGFGTGKGQLFGEGGLVANVTQPFRQGLANPIATLLQTGGKTLNDVIAGKPLGIDESQVNQVNQLNAQAQQLLQQGKRQEGQAMLGKARQLSQGINTDTALGNTGSAIEKQTPFLVSNQENQDYMSNPLLGGAKAGVGIASYAVPVGGASTILGAGGRAAVAGAGLGFGTSRPGQELNDTLAGAATGFATGAALKFLNPVFNKIAGKANQIGSELKGNVLEVDPNKLKFSKYVGVTGGKQLENDALGVIKELGYSPSTKQQAAEAIDTSIKSLQAEIGNKASQYAKPFNTSEILDEFTNSFKNNTKVLKNPGVQEIALKVADLGDNATAKDLAQIKFDLQSQINYNRGTNAVPELERGLRTMEGIVDSKLQEIPGFKDTLKQLSILHEAQPFATKTATTGGMVKLPIVEKFSAAPITDRLQTGAGNLLQSRLPLGNAAQNILPRVGSMLGIQQSQVPTGTDNNQPLPPALIKTLINKGPTVDPTTGQEQDILKSILLQGVASGEVSPSDAKAYQDLYGGGGKAGNTLPASQVADIAGTTSGLNQVAQLQQTFDTNPNLFDPILANIAQQNPYDSRVQSANSVIYLVKQIIGKGLEGGILRAEDEVKYQKILPQLTDTPAVVQQKLNNLTSILSDKYNTLVDSYGKAGYDVSGFGLYGQ